MSFYFSHPPHQKKNNQQSLCMFRYVRVRGAGLGK